MKSVVHLLVFDGFADWEPALACAEINKSTQYQIQTVGFSHGAVESMAGLRILPDLSLEELDAADSALLVVPGGDMWEGQEHSGVTTILQRFEAARAPLALICGATIAGARAGLLNDRAHTSNFKGYLERFAPGYHGGESYRDTPAIADHDVITASGMGSVEFASEILKLLKIYDPSDLEMWLTIYRDKVVPGQLQVSRTAPS